MTGEQPVVLADQVQLGQREAIGRIDRSTVDPLNETEVEAAGLERLAPAVDGLGDPFELVGVGQLVEAELAPEEPGDSPADSAVGGELGVSFEIEAELGTKVR